MERKEKIKVFINLELVKRLKTKILKNKIKEKNKEKNKKRR